MDKWRGKGLGQFSFQHLEKGCLCELNAPASRMLLLEPGLADGLRDILHIMHAKVLPPQLLEKKRDTGHSRASHTVANLLSDARRLPKTTLVANDCLINSNKQQRDSGSSKQYCAS